MSEIYRFVIRTIAPIHIGCDEVYDPLSFAVHEEEQKISVFSPFELVQSLSTQRLEEFSALCQSGTISSILKIYKFMAQVRPQGRKIEVTHGFVKHYRKTLSIPEDNPEKVKAELNRFIIWRTAFLAEDERPYIPGSALKGSLRTAYLNLLASKKNVGPFKRNEAKKLETALLDGGQFSTDPFRCVKVSDFRPVGHVKTKILYAVNQKKGASRFNASGPPQILEVIEPGSLFEGTITIQSPHPRAKIKSPIRIKDLMSSLDYFYRKEKQREDQELRALGISGVTLPQGDSDIRIIRLGRHSGAECVTINGHRSIKIIAKKGGKQRWEKAATTLWLASPDRRSGAKGELVPFGWAEFIVPEPSLLKSLSEKEESWKKQWAQAKALSVEMLRKREKEAIEKRREQERLRAEEEKKRREQEKKQAYLSTLPPEQRDILRLKEGDIQEEEVVAIYSRIDQYPDDKKKEVAQALKEWWISKGKWSGKQSKKQKIKIKKIREILGG